MTTAGVVAMLIMMAMAGAAGWLAPPAWLAGWLSWRQRELELVAAWSRKWRAAKDQGRALVARRDEKIRDLEKRIREMEPAAWDWSCLAGLAVFTILFAAGVIFIWLRC